MDTYNLDFKTQIQAFLNDESGVTAIEYGVIASMISVAIVAGVSGIGTKVLAKFTTLDGLL